VKGAEGKRMCERGNRGLEGWGEVRRASWLHQESGKISSPRVGSDASPNWSEGE